MSDPQQPAHPSKKPTPEEILRDLLIALLNEASEIEQQLMLQYLYAAFSMKKRPDATCSPAQYESVRRWTSTLFLVARQEMEHLALVNGMLTAIGAQPFFDRQNIPLQTRYYLGENLSLGRDRGGTEPCDIPFDFTPFSVDTIQRFICAESPSRKTLEEYKLRIPEWCFSCGPAEKEGEAGLVQGVGDDRPLAESHVPDELWERASGALAAVAADLGPLPPVATTAAGAAPALTTPEGVSAAPSLGEIPLKPGTIQELYDLIELLFVWLDSRMNLFTGNPSQQVFVVVEYQINIFPITDLASTRSALRLIVEEGEGIDSPPDYQSHFLRFYSVYDELCALRDQDDKFEPALPLPVNPSLDRIENEEARDLFELFDYTYATLVFMLTSLYRNYQPEASQSYPFLSSALQEVVFGPMMTMLIRPLAEVMAYTKSGEDGLTTGAAFHLSEKDRELLQNPGAAPLGNIEFFVCRLDEIRDRLAALARLDEGKLGEIAREREDASFLARQLPFIHESALALGNNLRRIYQIGQLPEFVVTP